jgi:hypothetical protein
MSKVQTEKEKKQVRDFVTHLVDNLIGELEDLKNTIN